MKCLGRFGWLGSVGGSQWINGGLVDVLPERGLQWAAASPLRGSGVHLRGAFGGDFPPLTATCSPRALPRGGGRARMPHCGTGRAGPPLRRLPTPTICLSFVRLPRLPEVRRPRTARMGRRAGGKAHPGSLLHAHLYCTGGTARLHLWLAALVLRPAFPDYSKLLRPGAPRFFHCPVRGSSVPPD